MAVVALVLVVESVMAQQKNDTILNSGCSQYNASSTLEFFRNLNTTLADLRREITVNKTYFGTQQQARTTNPVYTMFQCRKYLSTAECVSCFDKAALDIRSICKLANGARVIYDDCFLRYPHCLITLDQTLCHLSTNFLTVLLIFFLIKVRE